MNQTTVESTAIDKVVQPHGGALNAGGTPGNRGGGRPSSTVRELCREGFREGIPKVVGLLLGSDDPTADFKITPADKIRALDVLGKYGLGEAKVILPDDLANVVVGALRTCERSGTISADQADTIAAAIDDAIRSM